MHTTSFNIRFLEHTEYYLSKYFANSQNPDCKWLWCDGIKQPDDNQLFIHTINHTKQVITDGWIGIDGQDNYVIIFKIGDKSLQRCTGNLDITDCLPPEDAMSGIYIDLEDKRLTVQLA